jgi:hypothetical protein
VLEAVPKGQQGRMLFGGGLELVARAESQLAKFPNLHMRPATVSLKLRQALRFYVAGLAVAPGEEAFLSYWTVLEHLFAEEGRLITGPLMHHGHAIEKCPVCTRSTVEKRHGESLKPYLVQLGATAESAKALLVLRQVVHGRTPDASTFERVMDLQRLVGQRLAILLGLRPDLIGQPAPLAMWAEGVTDAGSAG